MSIEVDSELWGEWSWEDEFSHDIYIDAAEPAVVAATADIPPFSKVMKKNLLQSSAVVGAVALFALGAGLYRPKDQTPTFAATKVDGCYVSDNWKWVVPRPGRGIDDLVIKNVEGVTSEDGKGAKCLMAARLVIASWSQNDTNLANNTFVDVMNPYDEPIIAAHQPYAVPYFATLKPQG